MELFKDNRLKKLNYLNMLWRTPCLLGFVRSIFCIDLNLYPGVGKNALERLEVKIMIIIKNSADLNLYFNHYLSWF